jgi:RND family efflux transporter MFP subunit
MTEQRHSALALHHEGNEPPPVKRRTILRRGMIAVVIVLLLLAIGGARTMILRVVHARTLATNTEQQSKPVVNTISAKSEQAQQTLQLPGTLLGQVESPLYARASGYVRHWYKDIGAEVNKGDLLAEIETPEIDQQLKQSIASREQATATLDLAHTSFQRWDSLRQKDVVSQQEFDERQGAYAQAQATVAAANADVRRLEELTSFKRVVAPFAGIVTRRNVDVGDLVDAGNGGAGRALFVVSQVDPLRLYVFVPQAYAQLIKAGQQITVTQSELSGQKFTGVIARTAGAIDTASRTLQVEISLPNHDHALLPGAFVQVLLQTNGSQAMTVPTNALLFRGDGTHIAIVGDDGHVKLNTVQIGRDFGTRVEILSGLTPADHLIINPPDSLADGDQVTVAPSNPNPQGGQNPQGAPGAPNDSKSPPAPDQPKTQNGQKS